VTAESCLPALKDELGAHLNQAAAADAGDYPDQSIGRAAIPFVGDCGAGRSIVKNTRFKERFEHQLRVEMFNALNHPHFGPRLDHRHGHRRRHLEPAVSNAHAPDSVGYESTVFEISATDSALMISKTRARIRGAFIDRGAEFGTVGLAPGAAFEIRVDGDCRG